MTSERVIRRLSGFFLFNPRLMIYSRFFLSMTSGHRKATCVQRPGCLVIRDTLISSRILLDSQKETSKRAFKSQISVLASTVWAALWYRTSAEWKNLIHKIKVQQFMRLCPLGVSRGSHYCSDFILISKWLSLGDCWIASAGWPALSESRTQPRGKLSNYQPCWPDAEQ